MQKLDSELELGFQPGSFLGPVETNRVAALLDDPIIDAISASVPRHKKAIPRREVNEPAPSPRLHTSSEMARRLAPDLQGLHRWD
jgi:hypothetical protein